MGDTPVCSCLPNYVGRSPNCRPECTLNSECPANLACIHEKCIDPCPGACGLYAQCSVTNHRPICTCNVGYTGDPFSNCVELRSKAYNSNSGLMNIEHNLNIIFSVISVDPIQEDLNPCQPSPCGANAVCRERNNAGSCSCLPQYFGDPYSGCRPECVTNSDCDRRKACANNKCKDPCPGVCGINAECTVHNHAPICACSNGYTGDASRSCHLIEIITTPAPQNPCNPSPCGANSVCREQNGHAICTCQPEFIGSPPNCKPECVVSSECSSEEACVSQRCSDPCPGICGHNAKCRVLNHSPICSCNVGYSGDPFIQCTRPST